MEIYTPTTASQALVPVSCGSTSAPEDDAPTPFPVETLPPTVAAIVGAVAECERVPPALPGVIALGVLSGSVGAGLAVRSGPQRTTRANVYFIGAAESGSGKSECFRRLAEPLLEQQRRQIEEWRAGTGPRLRSEAQVLKKEIEALEAKASKRHEPEARERLIGEVAYKQARREEVLSEAHEPLITAQDITAERLAVLLDQNHEVIFSTSADARKLVDNLLGRYGTARMTDEALYLSAFSGDFVRVDRQGREPVTLNHPCLALLWLLQPDALELMLDESSLSASGFIPRCLMAHTRATPRHIEGESSAIPEPVQGAWKNLVQALLRTFRRPGVKEVVESSPEASLLLVTFHNEVVDRREVELADVGSFAARWAEQAWRLSVVLHAAAWGAQAHEHALAADTAAGAITLARWFADEQLALLARGRRERARKLEDEVLELLDRRWDQAKLDHLTVREVQRSRVLPTAAECQALLDRMTGEGLLVVEEIVPPAGGRTQRLYRRATVASRQPQQ